MAGPSRPRRGSSIVAVSVMVVCLSGNVSGGNVSVLTAERISVSRFHVVGRKVAVVPDAPSYAMETTTVAFSSCTLAGVNREALAAPTVTCTSVADSVLAITVVAVVVDFGVAVGVAVAAAVTFVAMDDAAIDRLGVTSGVAK